MNILALSVELNQNGQNDLKGTFGKRTGPDKSMSLKLDKDKFLRISSATKKLLVQARGCLEKKDGKQRSLDQTIRELAENEIKVAYF